MNLEIFDETLNVITKMMLTLLYKYMNPLFWLTLISFFSKLCDFFSYQKSINI